MYHVRIESTPVDDDVALALSAGGRLEDLQLADGSNARGASIELDSSRRTLTFACTIDAASDARLAILLAGSEFDKQLEALGAVGVRIQHAEAGPERPSGVRAEPPADFVTSAEAAAMVGVDTLRFKALARNAGFPAACGQIDVYSRSAVRHWAEVRGLQPAALAT